MELFGKRYTKNQLRQRIGNPDQIAGIRLVQLENGNERPGRAALFHTGSGLEFTVLLDRGMDVAAASHNGRAMGWRSVTGDVAPQFFEPEGIRWLRSYFGGLVTTCGLTNVGVPEEGSELSGRGLHGRINHTPARDIKITQEWQGHDYALSVSGIMRETSVFGENLTLTRTVRTALGEKRLWIEDTVTNEGFDETPLMVLYHCNIGWPAVDEESRMIAPSRRVAPRDDTARKGIGAWNRFEKPKHGYQEQVFYHDMKPQRDGSVTTAIVNNGFESGAGFGVYVRYQPGQLPRFAEWKQMGEQTYVVGLEPCNCGIEGRHVDEELGLLDYLKPGEQRTFTLEFGAVTESEEVKAIDRRAGKAQAKAVDRYTAFVKPPR